MSEEFCLSEKRKVWVPSDNYAYLPEDVKEFIRRLKKEMKEPTQNEVIDKIAGKGLI